MCNVVNKCPTHSEITLPGCISGVFGAHSQQHRFEHNLERCRLLWFQMVMRTTQKNVVPAKMAIEIATATVATVPVAFSSPMS